MYYCDALQHPYPSEEEKRLLASQTNVTVSQISNWYAALPAAVNALFVAMGI